MRADGVDPVIDAAVDAALAAAEIDMVDADLPGWGAATDAGRTMLFGEAWQSLGAPVPRAPRPDRGTTRVERFVRRGRSPTTRCPPRTRRSRRGRQSSRPRSRATT